MRDAGWWDRAAEVYDRAAQARAEERDAVLDAECGADAELRREVESLLAQDVSRPGLLEEVAENARRGNPAFATDLPVTGQIGRYRILGLIAEGGMGAVYEAEQDNPRRVVALKIVRPGLARAETLRRFERETQALGRLEHPNIARIYEAGVSDRGSGPQPYFAMERIHGESLTAYAERRSLAIPAKVQLMIAIVDAIQHAHERGIVHRDLKPANILVDAAGQPKVVDFGVAHVNDGGPTATRQTSNGEILGTLAYMSPEQILGKAESLDCRSDVYALGVLLYELLANKLPYEIGRNVHDAVRVICEGTIAPLGAAARELRGDLETIAGKALEKQPERRYARAADLSADLRRYLARQPIEARRPSVLYQARKFAERNRMLVGTLAAIFVVLAGGLLATSREALRANRAERAAIAERDRAVAAERSATTERDRAVRAEQAESAQRTQAEAERNRAGESAATAKAVSDFLQQDLLAQAGAREQAVAGGKPDANLTVRTALDRAAARIGTRFEREPAVEATIRETIGKAYQDLSVFPEAVSQFAKALELRRKTQGENDPAAIETTLLYANALLSDGRVEAALPLMLRVLEVRRKTLGERDPATLMTMNDVVLTTARAHGTPAEMAERLVQVLAAARQVLGPDAPETLVILNNLASTEVDAGAYAKAERLYTEAIEARRRVSGPDHPSTLLCMNGLGVVLRYEGKFDQAEKWLQEAYRRRLATEGEEHLDTTASMTSLGLLYAAEGRLEEADRLLTRSLELRRKVLGGVQANTLQSVNSLGELREKQGRLEAAEQLFELLVSARRKALPAQNPNLLNALAALGRVRFEQSKFQEAEEPLEEAAAGFAQAGIVGWRAYYAECVSGENAAQLGKYTEAGRRLTAGYEKLAGARETMPFENRGQVDQVRLWLARLPERTESGRAAKDQ